WTEEATCHVRPQLPDSAIAQGGHITVSQVWFLVMFDLRADQDQSRDAVAGPPRHFDRARAAHRATDHDERLVAGGLQDAAGPCLHRIAKRIEGRCAAREWESLPRPVPHPTVERKAMKKNRMHSLRSPLQSRCAT